MPMPNTTPIPKASAGPTGSFEEIRAVTRSFPAEDMAARIAARRRLDGIEAIEGKTGFLGDLAFWLATAQRKDNPRTAHPRVALFAATHGIASDVPASSAAALSQYIAALIEGGGALNRLAEAADTDLRVYELALDRPSADSRTGGAMDEAGASHATAYGMMAVEPGIDILVIAALGIGAKLAAEALIGALTAGQSDPLTLLAKFGGADIAAMLGAILAARLAGVAVILDGTAALAAGALAARLSPGGADHCAAAGDLTQSPLFDNELTIESILKHGIETPFAGVAALFLVKSAATLLA